MTEFWAAAKSFGFGAAAVVAVGLFFVKYLWPYLIKQNETAQKRLDDATDAFLKSLKEQREADQQGIEKLAILIGLRADRTDDKIDRGFDK